VKGTKGQEEGKWSKICGRGIGFLYQKVIMQGKKWAEDIVEITEGFKAKTMPD
jgi:hypothetical protein